MAKRKTVDREGWGKLLEAWEAPEGAGEPVGCLATTFTFSPGLFEEHCLSRRFLRLDSTPEEDGPGYLIEREEKLSQASCAVIVDQHHCSGSRSLRWDLLPARPQSGILHAKISLLHWSRHIRLIIASANLTEDGYRRNQEVFGVLDYSEGGEAPLVCLRETVGFLRGMMRSGVIGEQPSSPALRRVDASLHGILRASERWGTHSETQRGSEISVWPVLSGPEQSDVFEALGKLWPAPSPAKTVTVLSPFLDPPEAQNKPAQEIWALLRKRGDIEVTYMLEVEELEEGERFYVRAPETLRTAMPGGRTSAQVYIGEASLEQGRPLHAKSLWLEDDRHALYMIGSSNFTSPGLGIGKVANLEANLAYVVDGDRNPRALKGLEKAFLQAGKYLDFDSVNWQPVSAAGVDDLGEEVPLPGGFREAIYDCVGGRAVVTLSFSEPLPASWSVCHEADERRSLYDEAAWRLSGAVGTVEIEWSDKRPPSGFFVRWEESPAAAWWPVNTATPAALPAPEELRELPLEVLVSVLTSAKPLHLAIRQHLSRRKSEKVPVAVVDPHDKVNTSRFLLRRTRRVSELLRALRLKLERPAPTEQSLQWRLRGPVGVTAVAGAIDREAVSTGERAFLLAELLMELGRVKPQTTHGCLPERTVRSAIRSVMAEVRALIPAPEQIPERNLRAYLQETVGALKK